MLSFVLVGASSIRIPVGVDMKFFGSCSRSVLAVSDGWVRLSVDVNELEVGWRVLRAVFDAFVMATDVLSAGGPVGGGLDMLESSSGMSRSSTWAVFERSPDKRSFLPEWSGWQVTFGTSSDVAA